MRTIRIGLALGIVALCLSGCSVNRATGGLSPGVVLSKDSSYFVETKLGGDKREIDKIIARQLTDMGYAATAGGAGERPDDVDVLVTYIDHWMWDITMYMLELTVTMSNAETGFTLANANSYHTSLSRKSPEEMVEEVLGNLTRPSEP
ncbi:MAG: hypothetical protein AAGD86_00430 [Pseudomonadota bacterium]